MIELTDAEPSPPGHRVHPQETWDRARDDYLAGLSGPAVCSRYGLGIAAFRRRAATGGWRRIDQPALEPSAPITVVGDLDEAGYFDLAEMAAIHLREAIVNARVTEAAAWLRLHLRLQQASVEDDALVEAVRRDEIERAARRAEANGVDEVDGVFSAPESTLSPQTRPHPETPVHPASSPAPAPDCGGESGRSGR